MAEHNIAPSVLSLDAKTKARLVAQGTSVSEIEVAIAEFCQRWQITELYLFGSVLRDDFCSDSDIDVMVSFTLAARWGLLALIQMRVELEAIFGRKIDVLTRKSIEHSENWIRRQEILSTAQLIYAT